MIGRNEGGIDAGWRTGLRDEKGITHATPCLLNGLGCQLAGRCIGLAPHELLPLEEDERTGPVVNCGIQVLLEREWENGFSLSLLCWLRHGMIRASRQPLFVGRPELSKQALSDGPRVSVVDLIQLRLAVAHVLIAAQQK